MKRRPLGWILFSTLFLTSISLYAQHDHMMKSTPEERANKLTEWMKKDLQLNNNQLSQVQAINLKYAQQNEQLKGSSETKEQKMKTMKETEASRDAELKGVLTADQFKKWQAKKSEAKEMGKEKMKEHKGR